MFTNLEKLIASPNDQKYEVVWANVANADLVVIIQYIRTDNPIAAADNQKKIKSKASELTNFPQKGRIVPELKQQGILQLTTHVINTPFYWMHLIADSKFL